MKSMIWNLYSIFRIGIWKLRYGKKIWFNTFKQRINPNARVHIKGKGLVSIKSLATRTNVHLSCHGGKLEIGNSVYFNRNCIVDCRKRISIGDNCLFGPNVCVYDHDHKFDSNSISKFDFNMDEVVIGKNCWIGAGVVILKGTIIGENTIVAAGTVVKGEIPSNSIVYNEKQLVIKNRS